MLIRLGNFWRKLGYFLHQHLVTLVGRLKKEKTLSVCLCRLGPFSRTKLSTANNHLFIYPLTSPGLRKSKKLENFSFFFKNRFFQKLVTRRLLNLERRIRRSRLAHIQKDLFFFFAEFFFNKNEDDHFRIRTRIVRVEWQVR